MSYDFLRRNRWALIVIGLPTFLAILYFGFIASDQYVAESRFVVKNQSERPGQLSSFASLIQTTGLSSGQEQTNEVLDYIRSRMALQDLQRHMDVHAIYANPNADFLSGYPMLFRRDKFENLYRFYGDKVTARLDTQTGLAVLQTGAFTPRDAQATNAALLDLSEALVNRLNVKANQNAISEAEHRVMLAQARARAARLAMAKYRNDQDLFDPAKQAAGVLEVTNKLVGEQASLQAQLDIMAKVTPQNPAIPALRERVAAIGQAIDQQNGRATGSSNGLASKAVGYENVLVEQEFATQALTAALASLEQARTEAARQQFYLERVVEPNAPDLPELPHRLKQIFTIFGASLCIYLIGWMLIVGILEHAPEE